MDARLTGAAAGRLGEFGDGARGPTATAVGAHKPTPVPGCNGDLVPFGVRTASASARCTSEGLPRLQACTAGATIIADEGVGPALQDKPAAAPVAMWQSLPWQTPPFAAP